MWLERAFPGYYYVPSSKHKVDEKKSQKIMPTSKTGEKKLNKTNTLIKFAFDQVIGSTINSLAFIAFFAYIDGRDITTALQKEFWPMRIASLKLWPAVSALEHCISGCPSTCPLSTCACLLVDTLLHISSCIGITSKLYCHSRTAQNKVGVPTSSDVLAIIHVVADLLFELRQLCKCHRNRLGSVLESASDVNHLEEPIQ